jgi:hypothetical protein
MPRLGDIYLFKPGCKVHVLGSAGVAAKYGWVCRGDRGWRMLGPMSVLGSISATQHSRFYGRITSFPRCERCL